MSKIKKIHTAGLGCDGAATTRWTALVDVPVDRILMLSEQQTGKTSRQLEHRIRIYFGDSLNRTATLYQRHWLALLHLQWKEDSYTVQHELLWCFSASALFFFFQPYDLLHKILCSQVLRQGINTTDW